MANRIHFRGYMIKVYLLDVFEENDCHLQNGFVLFELILQLLLQHGNLVDQLSFFFLLVA